MSLFTFALPIGLLLFCGLDILLTHVDARGPLLRKWPLHGGLALAGQMVALLIPFTGLSASVAAQEWGFGLGQHIRAIDPVSGLVADTVIWMLALTFAVYVMHYAEHKFHALWAFHRIHHNDEQMDTSTAIRHHPFEAISSILVISALAFLLTPSLTALLIVFVLTVAVDLFNHSRIEIPGRLSTALEWVITTPRVHRVHHSDYAPQTDSNFGGTFTFWDRLFGTYRVEIPARIGLDDPAISGAHSRDFDTLIFEPFRYLVQGRAPQPESKPETKPAE